jgi:hypothetical protein
MFNVLSSNYYIATEFRQYSLKYYASIIHDLLMIYVRDQLKPLNPIPL